MDYWLAASCGCSVSEVWKAFNEIRVCRYSGDYLIELYMKNELKN
jgi:hypothetical protein